MLGKTFMSVYSSDHLTDIHKPLKDLTLVENKDVKLKREDGMSTLDVDLEIGELNIALLGTGYTSPGQDQQCYGMFRQLPIQSLKLVLRLFNKIWKEGMIQSCLKSAVILPFNKPGKDPTNPGNYRPIAQTSHLSKWMERIIVCRISHVLEQRGLLTNIQSGFQKGLSTTDALVRVSNEVEKALRMKELMIIVYFDIEKAHDSMWRDGLLIKISRMDFGGMMYN